MLRIEFPTQEAAGTILFFRPSNSREDQLVLVKPDADKVQFIPTSKLAKGLWRVKINWQSEGVKLYHEDSVVI
jgi:nitrogen fixation protein FixH